MHGKVALILLCINVRILLKRTQNNKKCPKKDTYTGYTATKLPETLNY